MDGSAINIIRKDTNESYSFSNGLNYCSNKFLFKNLINNKPITEESLIGVQNLDNNSVITIKVNVHETGVFLFYFNSEMLVNEKREKLLEEISKLKSLGDKHKQKVVRLLKIVKNYEPLFCCFYNQLFEVADRNFFESICVDKLGLTIIIFFHDELNKRQPREKKAKVNKKSSRVSIFIKNLFFNFYYSLKSLFLLVSLKIRKNKKQEATQIKKEKIKKTNVKVKSKKEHKKLELYRYFYFEIDFIFMFIFGLIGSFSLLAGISYAQNGDALCAFLFVLFAVFFAILMFSSYSYQKEHKKHWKYNLENLLMPCLFTLIGLTGGCISSYFTSKAIIKVEDAPNVNFELSLWITIGVSAFMLICFVVSPLVFNFFMKFKKNKTKVSKETKEKK